MLARAGICLHRLGWLGPDAQSAMPPMAGMAMPGMPMGDGPMPPGTMCPVLVWASIVAGILCLFALVSLLAMRPRPATVAFAAARFVTALRVGPLTALLCLAGSIPLTAATAMDGGFVGLGPLVGAALLVVAAALSALALVGVSRAVLSFARRLAGALVAAFRLLVPGAESAPFGFREPLLIPAGVRLARRRPSRAPPLR
ncbi:MAG TPA: hypothetical protein VMA36_02695 [Candidatus Limnocylindria bacterium]|nr:hypothetical protein [Candidatus Limnocylindria bacterium]